MSALASPAGTPASTRGRLVSLIDEPTPFDLGDLFFSITDPGGMIRHGNEVFRRLAGYPLAKMVGRPHSLIRHPDMPRCVFDLFWGMLKAHQPIVAYVKNRSADGRYYWVLAYAMPCDGGYLSVRMKPCTPWFDTQKTLYQALRKVEEAAGGQNAAQRAAGMKEAAAMLESEVRAMGFANYDALMRRILIDEVRTRDELLRQPRPGGKGNPKDKDKHKHKHKPGNTLANRSEDYASRWKRGERAGSGPHDKPHDRPHDRLHPGEKTKHPAQTIAAAAPPTPTAQANAHLQDIVDRLFVVLTELNATIEGLQSNSTRVVSTAADMRILGINSVVSVSRLGAQGASLGVISKALIDLSKAMEGGAAELDKAIQSLSGELETLLSDLSATRLLGEQLDSFVRDAGSENLAAVNEESDGAVAILVDQLRQRTTDVFERLARANEQVRVLLRPVTALDRIRRSMFPMMIIGRKEAAPVDAATSFRVVMDRLPSFELALETGLGDTDQRLRDLLKRSSVVVRQERSVANALKEVRLDRIAA